MNVEREQMEQNTERTIHRGALFLVDMHVRNLYEEVFNADNRLVGHKCKVCDEQVLGADWESHRELHIQDRSHYATEQIRARRNDMASKTPKVTPLSQGVPAEYLNEDGTKFLPGYDAKYKSDAIKTILAEEHGKTDIDLATRLVQLDLQAAKEVLSARGWNGNVITALKASEAREARAAAKTATKSDDAKAKAKAKREAAKAKVQEAAAKLVADVDAEHTAEVTPDPKPERKPRKTRTLRSA